MKYKVSWIAIIFLPILIFFLISFMTIKDIYTYFLLNQKTTGEFIGFDVIDSKNKCRALIKYSFKINDKIFKSYSSTKDNFLNHYTLQDYIKELPQENLTIWFNKKNPNISSIEKNFPIKNCIYLVVTLLIFAYFLVLKFYVYRFEKSD